MAIFRTAVEYGSKTLRKLVSCLDAGKDPTFGLGKAVTTTAMSYNPQFSYDQKELVKKYGE